jgi:hypothetical protein
MNRPRQGGFQSEWQQGLAKLPLLANSLDYMLSVVREVNARFERLKGKKWGNPASADRIRHARDNNPPWLRAQPAREIAPPGGFFFGARSCPPKPTRGSTGARNSSGDFHKLGRCGSGKPGLNPKRQGRSHSRLRPG